MSDSPYRGLSGLHICASTFTNELRFAYRIGSFYYETSRGLRRGAIREVPIEETRRTIVAEEVRGGASAVIGGDGDDSAARQRPSIIEVPQWLARLEPMLARHDDARKFQEHEEHTPTHRTLF